MSKEGFDGLTINGQLSRIRSVLSRISPDTIAAATIRSAIELIERLWSERSNTTKLVDQLQDAHWRIAQLQNEIAAERRDGMRWRYIRANHTMRVSGENEVGAHWEVHFTAHAQTRSILGFNTIDDAVDAQMDGNREQALLRAVRPYIEETEKP